MKAEPFKVGGKDQIRLLHDARNYYSRVFEVRNIAANGVVWLGDKKGVRDVVGKSLGSKNRLNRLGGSAFGSEDYAKEELVAELTAALIGHSLGFNTRVRENNAAYLSSWLKSLKEEPKFLVSVLSDVSKAAQMIESSLFHKEVA